MRASNVLAILFLLALGGCADEAVDSVSAAATDPKSALSRPPFATPPRGHVEPSAEVGTLPGQLTVDDAGAAHYAIPLWVPEGRLGMQPNLSLMYSSRGGNGPLGVGWTLTGMSEISRCSRTVRQDGFHRNARFDDDAYCLGGSRLVLARNDTIASGRRTYVVEGDPLTKAVVDGANPSNPREPRSWTVWFSDGTIGRFGDAASSRLEGHRVSNDDERANLEVDAHSSTLRWHQTELRDRFDNSIRIEHSRLVERSRHFGVDTVAYEVVPRSIRYTNHPSLGDGDREIRFRWELRPDKAHHFFDAFFVQRTRRLEAIEVRGPDPDRGALALLRRYDLTYRTEELTNASQIIAVTACDGFDRCLPSTRVDWVDNGDDAYAVDIIRTGIVDVQQQAMNMPHRVVVVDADGDGLDDLLYRAADDGGLDVGPYRLALARGDSRFFNPVDVPGLAQWIGDHIVRPIDIERDGRTELAAFIFFDQTPHHHAWRFEPNRRTYVIAEELSITPNTTETIPFGGGAGTVGAPFGISDHGKPPTFVDLDGDGRLDFLGMRYRYGGDPDAEDTSPLFFSFVMNRVGEGLRPENERTPGLPPGENLMLNLALDIDADGRGDYLHWRDGRLSWMSLTPGGLLHFQPTNLPNWLLGNASAGGQMLDINGDGAPDRGITTDYHDTLSVGALPIEINTTRGFGAFFDASHDRNYRFSAYTISGGLAAYTDRDNRITDYNFDGIDDLLVLMNPDENVVLYESTGYGYVRRELDWTPGPRLHGFALAEGDFDGDGVSDFVRINPTTYELEIVRRRAQRPNRVVAVTNGLGKRDQVEYASIASFERYEPIEDVEPWQSRVTRGVDVVAALRLDGGEAGERRVEYAYQGARTDLDSSAFLGFDAVSTLDHGTGVATWREYDWRTRLSDGRYANPGPVAEYSVATTGRLLATRTLRGSTVRTVRVLGRDFLVVRPDSVESSTYDAVDVDVSYEGEGDPRFTTDLLRRWGDRALTMFWPPTGGDFRMWPDAVDEIKEPLTRTHVTYQYDAFAYPERTIEDSEGGRSAEVYERRRHDESRWLFGNVEYRSTSSHSARGSATQTETYAYDRNTGALASAQQHPLDPTLRLDVVVEREPRIGVVTRTTLTDPATGRSRSVHARYDERWMEVIGVANDLGHVTWTATHPSLGVELEGFDLLGNNTRTFVDGFGRVVRVESPDGVITQVKRAPRGEGGAILEELAWGHGHSRTYVDRAANAVSSESLAPEGRWRIVERKLDAAGRVVAESAPRFRGEADHWSTFEHDPLGRVIRSTAPDGATTKIAYEGLLVTAVDARGFRTIERSDVNGDVVETWEELVDDAGSRFLITRREHGAFGRLEEVKDTEGNVTTMRYDVTGQLAYRDDPDTGTTEWVYDAFGEIATETRERITTRYRHDAIGRPIRIEHDRDGVTVLEWDDARNGLGQLARAFSPDGTELYYDYDDLGRPSELHQIPHDHARIETKFVVSMTYDGLGRVEALYYPDVSTPGGRAEPGTLTRYSVRYGYDDASGALHHITDPAGHELWRSEEVDAWGGARHVRLGNGADEHVERDPRTGRIDRHSLDHGGRTLEDVRYAFDSVGNLELREDQRVGRVERFVHDALGRVTGWDNDAGTVRFVYDDLGNLTERISSEGVEVFEHSPLEHGPHQLTAHHPLDRDSYKIGYDTLGRRVRGPHEKIEYSRHDLPTYVLSSTGDESRFFYDAFGRRAAKESGKNFTHYFAGLFERRETPEGLGFVAHVSAGDRAVAQVALRPDADVRTGEVAYLHVDHLGSTSLVTDAAGEVVERVRHDPFGRRLDEGLEPMSTDLSDLGGVRRGFTGHEQDDDLGWINASGRIYDPNTARFLTPDPIWHPEISQGLNPFSYVRNRPLTLIDPSGFDPLDPLPPPAKGMTRTVEHGWTIDRDAAGNARGWEYNCASYDCSGIPPGASGSSVAGASDDGGHRETAPSSEGDSLSPRFNPFAWAAAMAVILVEDGLSAVYQFAIGDDLDTLASPDASGGEKVLAVAALLPIGKILKGLRWAGRLAMAGIDFLQHGARAADAVSEVRRVTGRVATRINIANGCTRYTPLRQSGEPVSAGWDHVLRGHFGRTVANNRSVFSVTPDELRAILQRPEVVRSPVTAIEGGQFVRVVDVGQAVGTSSLNNGGGVTSVIKVITDEAGNLITVFPL
jgi:RHS repeat-associated protein